MRDGILNLCRVKLRDQQRLEHGPLGEYPNEEFGDAVPRSGNASGGGHPGCAVRCQGEGANDYLYLVIQPQVWEVLAKKIGRPELVDDPDYETPEKRLPHLTEIFGLIEEWTLTREKWAAFRELNEVGVPCGPILDTHELLEDPDLAATAMIVEVEHPTRGRFKTVGCPFKLSDSPVEIVRSPLLGEHSDEIVEELLGDQPAERPSARDAA
jgi:formyl-CoA transferase